MKERDWLMAEFWFRFCSLNEFEGWCQESGWRNADEFEAADRSEGGSGSC